VQYSHWLGQTSSGHGPKDVAALPEGVGRLLVAELPARVAEVVVGGSNVAVRAEVVVRHGGADGPEPVSPGACECGAVRPILALLGPFGTEPVVVGGGGDLPSPVDELDEQSKAPFAQSGTGGVAADDREAVAEVDEVLRLPGADELCEHLGGVGGVVSDRSGHAAASKSRSSG
jgi:hypothetical protein